MDFTPLGFEEGQVTCVNVDHNCFLIGAYMDFYMVCIHHALNVLRPFVF